MSNVLRVRWTITPQIAPRPWLNCNRCGGARAFHCSGKIRLNANGRRLDAWLIYKCGDCDNSWNRPLFERRNIRDIEPSLLRALQTNEPDWVRRMAFDVEDLRCSAERVEEFGAVEVHKQILREAPEPIALLEILLRTPAPTSLRSDRLLAMELGLSRKRIEALFLEGRLTIVPNGARMLRRSVRDGMRIRIEALAKGDALDLKGATDNLDATYPSNDETDGG